MNRDGNEELPGGGGLKCDEKNMMDGILSQTTPPCPSTHACEMYDMRAYGRLGGNDGIAACIPITRKRTTHFSFHGRLLGGGTFL